MKKAALIAYLVLTLSIGTTFITWVTWGSACGYTYYLPEGTNYNGLCTGDGMQFIGIFAMFLMLTILYLLLTALVLKVLGFKLTKKS